MRSLGISSKLILLTLAMWALLAVPGALLELSNGLSRQRDALQQTRQQVRTRMEAVLSDMLWNMDVPAIRSFIVSELIPADVVAIRVFDELSQRELFCLRRRADGTIMDQAMPTPGGALIQEDIPIRRQRDTAVQVIGIVSVTFDAEPGNRVLRRGLLVDIGGSLLVITLLCIVLVVVLDRNLVKPIDLIRRRMDVARRLPPEVTPTPMPLPAAAFVELKVMAADLEQMLADLNAASVTMVERERLYRTLFDGGADAVLVLDGTCIREASHRADALFGVPVGGLAGRELPGLALECQPDGQPSPDMLAKRLQAADGSLFPWRAQRPDGHLIDVEIALSRVAMAGSTVVLASLRDVTERNHLETQLRQVQKMETIGQLAGGVAHDFNNVLLAIMGSAELLARQAGQDARSRELAEGILNASQRAASLVRQLLAFSRKQGAGSTPLNLHVVLRETAELLARTVLDQRIRVELRLESPLATVIGDSAMLQNALLNLGVNARDAMPDGGCITFATRLCKLDEPTGRAGLPELAPGDYIEVAIIDTGTGMSDEVRRRCFEAFFTTKDPGKGTGLGLAAVAKTVHDHSGTIEVDSTPGMGATFRLLLPVTAQQATKPTPYDVPVSSGSGRILVVDDDDLIRRVSCQLLDSLGYAVVEASDGAAGVAAYFEQGPFDLMLVDMEMPSMRGIECLRTILASDPQAKAVLCSGFSRDGDALQLQADGFRGFLNKPYRLKELAETVAAVMAGGRCFADGNDLHRSSQ